MASIPAGTVFQDRYEILSLIGEGGFGQVYRARHRVTHQVVALKMLKALHLQDEHQVARFRREMQLCAQLYHPHIVRLIDSGVGEAGQLYSVFEFVPGQTLAEVLVQGALEPWEAAHLMLQVLDALGAAHKQGVIHRDLKPQNIMVTTTGVRRNALVLDFGLGTLSQEARKEEMAPLTRSREVLGTPSYSAPEQLRAEPATARSDLYSWGLVFLECLTGKRVMDGPTLQQVLLKQLGPAPIPFPDWLERHRLGRLLRRTTQKEQETREVTAEVLLRDLEAMVREGWPEVGPQPGANMSTSSNQGVIETLITRKAEGERRQLTAVCCSLELVGEQAQEDIEELDRLQRGLYAALGELARRFDAHVGGVLAERMLMFLGYPVAREDDARRAASLALELVAEMGRRGEALARSQGLRLEVRVGIHTGLVVSQELRARSSVDAATLVGPVPTGASRLESLAQPGTVLVSAESAKLLRDHFALEPASAARVGSRAMQAFRLGGELRSQAAGESGKVTPLYGRAQELALLQQRWQQTVAGSGQAMLLTGEPGIGKSRLAQELAQRIEGTPHTFLEVRCAPEGRNSTLRPVVELLERMLGFNRDWTAEQASTALEALLKQHGFDLSEAMPLFGALLPLEGASGRFPALDVSPQRAKELTLEALAALLFEMAQQRPVLLMMEDLHWADPTTLELLSHLVEDVYTTRLCLVLTSRPEFSAPWTASQVLQVQLSRLDRQHIEEMVKGITQDTPLPYEVLEQVVSRTDGVPLFVEELTRMLVELLSAQSGASTPSPTPTRLAIPSTLRDSLMARLDRLGAAKETAQLAAALGREFSYEVLKAVSTHDETTLKQDLETLVAADLVHRRRGVRPVYLFKHALIRDTAYESMVRPARRQVHARIASTLELRFRDLVESRPDLLAQHHASAEQKRQAIAYAQKASLQALMRSANQEAIGYATEALGWLDAIEDTHERMQLELALRGIITPALMGTRGWSDQGIKAQVDRCQELIEQLGDSPAVVPNLWALLTFHHTRGHRQQARALAERLLAMEGLSQDVGHQVMMLPGLGHCAWIDGQHAEAREAFSRALSLYEEGKHRHMAHVYGLDAQSYAGMGLGLTLLLMGYPDQALERAKAAVAWAKEIRHTSTLGLAYIYLLMVLQERGDRSQILAVSDEALEMTAKQSLPVHGAYCRILRSWATRSADGLRDALAMQEALGFELGMTYYASLMVQVEAGLGQRQAALERAEGLMSRGRASGELYYIPQLLCLKAGLLFEQEPDSATGEACLREALAMAHTQDARLLELRAALGLGRLLHRRGNPAEARAVLQPVLAAITEGETLAEVREARELLAALGQG